MNINSYFLNLAQAVSMKSKDPSSKVGAVIVDRDNRIVSTGYNGMVAGADESKLTWDRPMKYHLVVHAELNAVLYARRDVQGCRVYITHGPCENCLKHMLQAQIVEIYYGDVSIMRDRSTPEQKEAIKRLIEATGAVVQNLNGKLYTEELYG